MHDSNCSNNDNIMIIIIRVTFITAGFVMLITDDDIRRNSKSQMSTKFPLPANILAWHEKKGLAQMAQE